MKIETVSGFEDYEGKSCGICGKEIGGKRIYCDYCIYQFGDSIREYRRMKGLSKKRSADKVYKRED